MVGFGIFLTVLSSCKLIQSHIRCVWNIFNRAVLLWIDTVTLPHSQWDSFNSAVFLWIDTVTHLPTEWNLLTVLSPCRLL